VQFAQEVWFLVINVPALAHRYQKQGIWVAVFLVLSISSTLVKNRLVGDASIRRQVMRLISWGSWIVTSLIFLLAFVDLVKDRLFFDEIVCTDISDDAYYHVPTEKAYELVERYRCSNRTGASVRNLPDLSDGYSEKIASWTAEYRLLGRPSVELVVHTPSPEQIWKDNYVGGSGEIHMYTASAEFQPPLAPGAEFEFVSRLSASGSPIEVDAFSPKGTMFAQALSYETLNYYLTIHAPEGFEVRLKNWGVIDQGGVLLPDETESQDTPKVSFSGELLQWQVSLGRPNLRYMLSYWFDAYGWQKP
jgi:hypothetical protein